MSKKHFIQLAEAIRNANNTTKQFSEAQIGIIADVCRANNDNFDRARFLSACGV
jgi:hypothetical protein